MAAFEFDLSRGNISLTADASILDTTMNTLRQMAEETDGRAIVNQNDLDPGLKQIARDSSAYYLIGLHDDAERGGRQVSPDQGEREAAEPAGARAQGLSRADRQGS